MPLYGLISIISRATMAYVEVDALFLFSVYNCEDPTVPMRMLLMINIITAGAFRVSHSGGLILKSESELRRFL
jgi:hypothetical protein